MELWSKHAKQKHSSVAIYKYEAKCQLKLLSRSRTTLKYKKKKTRANKLQHEIDRWILQFDLGFSHSLHFIANTNITMDTLT